MTTEEKMTVDDRLKYLRRMKRRYTQADRKERSQLLQEMEAFTGMHRKSLIRRMNSRLERKPRRKQRGRSYGPEVDDALRVIAESLDYICAKRMMDSLVQMATHLAAHGELTLSPQLLEQLDRISLATVKRILARIRQDDPRLPRRQPVRARRLTRDIPMKRIPWDEQEPGHFEVDLVHHCGPTAWGEYVCTLQMIDVATGWSERQAVLGRSYRVIEDAFRRILNRLPFCVKEIHPDNDSAFFNYHLLRFWKDKVQGVQLSRSRPYRKNDNRFVEQKNATLVRRYLGYDRLDTVAHTLALNQLYQKMWRYYNFFQPVMRLKEKTVVPADGQPARIKRCYDKARTPFQRLCLTSAITPERRTQLQAFRDQTNPRQWRLEIYDLIDHIFALPNAVPGTTEDVFQTLIPSSDQKMEQYYTPVYELAVEGSGCSSTTVETDEPILAR